MDSTAGLRDCAAVGSGDSTHRGGGGGGGDALVPWRTAIDASIARSRKVRGANYVQIATVDSEGHPCCRTVVQRGFLAHGGNSDTMRMITDARSEKAKHAARGHTAAEMVWWFGKSSEQYRIRGVLQMIGDAHADSELVAARKQQWGNLSDPGREQFFWTSPGAAYPAEDVVLPKGGRDGEGKVLPPPATFLLMLLRPTRVDYLRLTDNFRQVDSLVHGEGWASQQVTP